MRSLWIISRIASLSLALPILSNETVAFPRADGSASHWTVSADFLAWYASEEVASIWADVITSTPNAASWSVPSFDFKWDYGFRIGVERKLEYDQWDTALHWSYFHTDAQHEIPSQSSTTVGAEFDAAFLAGITHFTSPRSMSARWSLLFNMFDWELGRRYSVSENVSIRPFLGFQGGWINQSIQAKYYDLIVFVIFDTKNSGNERLHNNFWGIGPLGGINTSWKICDIGSHSFDFCGDLSAATMWGNWTCSDFYKNTLSQSYSIDMKNDSLGAFMFRGFCGLGWGVHSRRGKSHLSAKIGYETQLWLNQLRIATFQLQRLHHDLTLQGLALHSRFDF